MTGTGDLDQDSTPAFGPEGLERRRAPRILIPPGAPLSVVGARLVRLSPFGMMIESLVPMERGAVLGLRLVVAREKIDLDSRVVACWPISGGRKKRFGIGLEFVGLAEAVRQRLRDALDSQVSAGSTRP